jgi:FMN-dependent NADH-azoreductase
MAKLLHVQASPRGKRSASQTVATHLIDTYRAVHANDTLETLDLWHAKLPELDGEHIKNSKYRE